MGGAGWEWDKERDLSRLSLYLGDIVLFDAYTSEFCVFQSVANLLQKEK